MKLKAFAVGTVFKRYRLFWTRIRRALCLAIAFLTLPPHLAGAAIGDRIELDVASAEATFDELYGKPVVTFTVTEASERVLAAFTMENVGKRMALRIHGRVIAKPVIREPVMGGSSQTD